MLTTQLGGKFSTEDSGLFTLKKVLLNAGINVAYPTGNSIVTVQNGVPLTFDPKTEHRSFYEIEIDYLKSIKDSDIHIIHNKHIDNLGYIGESASVELAYALVHNKPVCLMYPPTFSDKVRDSIKQIINKNADLFLTTNLIVINNDELHNTLSDYASKAIKYRLNVLEEIEIYNIIKKTLNSYIIRDV